MAIRIITDSASDLEESFIQTEGIGIINLPLTFGETVYESLDKDIFYEMLAKCEELPKTSQPSPQTVLDVFEEAKEAGDSVVAIVLSSALSGTYQCFQLAKQMADYDEIYIVDSLSATIGMAYQVKEAVRLRNEGLDAATIAEKVDQFKSRVTLYAVMNTLENLYKGGRLNKAAAQVGTIANLKPIITLSKEGEVAVTDKCIGLGMSGKAMLKKLKNASIDPFYPVQPIYSYDPTNCQNFLAKLAVQMPEIQVEEPMNIGSVIGTHIGPEAYGIVYVEAE